MSCHNSLAGDIVQKFWNWRLTNAPEYATSIGVHKHDDRMDEMSLNAYSRFEMEGKMLLEEVKGIAQDNTGLSNDTILNLELIVAELQQLLHGMTFKSFLFPICAMLGPHRTIPALLGMMKRESSEDIAKMLSGLRQVHQQIDEVVLLLKEGLRLGLVHHKVSVENCPQILKDMVAPPVEKSPLFKVFVDKPEQFTAEDWRHVVAEAKEIIQTKISPSFLNLADFLRDKYLPWTRGSIALVSLPRGRDYYAACLSFHTTTNLTPQQIHELGVSEVTRIKHLMEELKEKVSFEGTIEQFCSSLLVVNEFNFSDGDEILAYYKKTVESIEEKIPQYFHILPTAGYDILPEVAAIAPTMPMGRYLGPTEEGGRGTFFVNTYKPEIRKKFDALALCLHEVIPGHHLQFALTNEAGLCPDFRRLVGVKRYNLVPGYFAMNTAYIEGWGLYAEYIGEEMGLYADPYDMFGRLQSEMLRASRLVVDTGMHAFGWSRDDAVSYMCKNSAMALHQIEAEIDRYISFPGQACGYKIGELKIKELRRRAEKKLGGRFDVQLFHHLVATMGPVPLDILEKKVELFINQHLKV